MPPEPPSEGDTETPEDEKEEEGIFGPTPEGARYAAAFDRLEALDPENPLLQQKVSSQDLASGMGAARLDAESAHIGAQRVASDLASGNYTISPNKIAGYALNPDNKDGSDKAVVFQSALGYNQSNANDLLTKIK
jgi:hypothetical protein